MTVGGAGGGVDSVSENDVGSADEDAEGVEVDDGESFVSGM